jgi:hypothetical protein
MQYKSILDILHAAAKFKQELAALPKLQYKKCIGYGYQLLLQFFALERWDVCVC